MPIWRKDAGPGKVSHQTVFKCHFFFLPLTPQNAAASAGSCPLLCSLPHVALGAKEAERGEGERSPCFSLLPMLGSPAESQPAGGEGPVCFSNGSKAFM